MTEEEYFRKNYPDSCYSDRPLSPHWDFFQDGVEFGERKSKKRIEELEKENEMFKKANEIIAQQRDGRDKADLVWKLKTANEQKADQLTKAKELIKYLLSFIQKENYKTRWDINIAEAEQFISEVEK